MNYLQNPQKALKLVYPVSNSLCRKLVSLLELPIIFDD